MKTINLIQGTDSWYEHRRNYDNASDAPAMMNCSPYKSRNELIKERATGIVPEISTATQRLFDDGHKFEALNRARAEEIVGEELYPVTGVNGQLGASFDGLTLGENINYEHKTLNKDIRAAITENGQTLGENLPLYLRVQMEQQCMVSGAEKTLFMATKWEYADEKSGSYEMVEEKWGWYYPDNKLATQITAGWEQFHKDVAAYKPAEVVAEIIAEPVKSLPALYVNVSGSIDIKDNFKLFEEMLRDFVDNALIKEPKTDQDFVDLMAQIKSLENAEAALKREASAMLAQVSSIDIATKTIDMLLDFTAKNRIKAQKDVLSKKEAIRTERVLYGQSELRKHIEALNASLTGALLPTIPSDFAKAIKGLRTIESFDNAINAELARAKADANMAHKKISHNLKTIDEMAGQLIFLFNDKSSLALKDSEAVVAIVNNRISEHKQKEEKRLEAERESIRKQERDKLEREAQEKADKEARDKKAFDDAARANFDKKQEERENKTKIGSVPVVEKIESDMKPSVILSDLPVVSPATNTGPDINRRMPLPQVQRPDDGQIIAVLMANYAVHENTIIQWLQEIDFVALTEKPF